MVGALALDGNIQPVRGVLAVALACRRLGIRQLLVPAGNHAEAAAVAGITVLAAATLADAIATLNGGPVPAPSLPTPMVRPPEEALDLVDVRGQAHARRALEIAAAGAHKSSVANPGTRSPLPCAKRHSMPTSRPSTYPSSRRRERDALCWPE